MLLQEQKSIQRTAVVMPEITGRAFIYGTCQLFVNPEDPYQMGISLSDMWGEAARLLRHNYAKLNENNLAWTVPDQVENLTVNKSPRES